MVQYISENMPPAEVLRLYGDHVPEFMRAWLERTVEQAEDGLLCREERIMTRTRCIHQWVTTLAPNGITRARCIKCGEFRRWTFAA